jgi:hypothetical protein
VCVRVRVCVWMGGGGGVKYKLFKRTRIAVLKQRQDYYPIHGDNACHTIKNAYRICGCENKLHTHKYNFHEGVNI